MNVCARSLGRTAEWGGGGGLGHGVRVGDREQYKRRNEVIHLLDRRSGARRGGDKYVGVRRAATGPRHGGSSRAADVHGHVKGPELDTGSPKCSRRGRFSGWRPFASGVSPLPTGTYVIEVG